MSGIRENAPKTVAGESVTTVRDYLKGTITDLVSGRTEETGLPSSNVLYYTTENCVLVIRPSGTEPKVKVYFMAKGRTHLEAVDRIEAVKKSAVALLGT
jgi:phosphoglucomutase